MRDKNEAKSAVTPKTPDDVVHPKRPETNAPAEQRAWTTPNKGNVAGRNSGHRRPKSTRSQQAGKKGRTSRGGDKN